MNLLAHTCYIILIITLIIALLIAIQMNHPPSLKGAYLNTSSTNARKTGEFNPSDLAYPQVFQNRSDMSNLFVKIKKLVNAPPFAKVIINSGATESIAQCVYWAKCSNQYGTLQGTDFDHSAVADNCASFNVPYNSTELRKGKLLDTCSAVMLTQVNSKTGEILNLNNFKRNVIDKYSYITGEPNENNPFNKHVRQYKPLIFIDATQSIMKTPIDMNAWGANAVFFSLHKIGGHVGEGILIINDPSNSFKPLISGKQQGGLRGGTYPLESILNEEELFDNFDDFNARKESWTRAVTKFEGAGLNVYKPRTDHLFNTILIDINHCPLGIINRLANKGIYVGNVSACANETETLTGGDKKEYKPFERAVRISFLNPDELTDVVSDEIIAEISKGE